MAVGCGVQEVERGKGMSSSDHIIHMGLGLYPSSEGLATNHGYKVSWC